MASDKFEDMLYEALTEQYQYGEGGHGGTELDKPIIAYVDGLEDSIKTLQSIVDVNKSVLDSNKEHLKECDEEILRLHARVIELEGKIKDFRSRAVHAEATVFRMLKWGKKYISEAWDEYDERVERKQAWDAIVAKYTESGNDQPA